MDPLRKLVRRLERVEKIVKRGTTQPQLGNSSIEDGALLSHGIDGSLNLVVGKQFDGTQTITVLNGPPPPTPDTPTADASLESVSVYWNGLWLDGAITPMNFGRVEIHASVDPDFVPGDTSTLVGYFESPRGGKASINLVPNTYYVKLIARSQSGVASPPSGSVAVTPISVGQVIADPSDYIVEAPTSSPDLTVTPSAQGFTLRVDDADGTMKVAYHASTEPGFTPGPDTLLIGDTRRNPVYVSGFPDGTGFDPTAIYYFKDIVSNSVGPSPTASAEVSSILTPIRGDQIISLDVGKLTSGDLQATVALLGLLKVGTNIVIDPDGGITITQLDGRSTVLAADGSGNTFVGTGTFDAAEFLDQVTFRGFNNFLHGVLTMSAGVPNPSQPPTVTTSWATQAHTGETNWQSGFCETSDGLGYAVMNTVLYESSEIQILDKDTPSRTKLADVPGGWLALGGITRVGPNYYVLVSPPLPGWSGYDNYTWRVNKYASDGTYLGNAFPGEVGIVTGSALPAIGSDGTNLFIAWTTAAGNSYIREYTTSGMQIGTAINFSTSWGQVDITSVNRSGLGMSGSRWIVTSANSLYCYVNTTGVRVPADEWPKAATIIRGLCVAGGTYHQYDGNVVSDYTLNKGTYDFGYTYNDTDFAGLGIASTKVSPLRTAAPTKFARWTVSLPSLVPDDGSTDGANTAFLYAAPTGGTLSKQFELPDGILTHTFTAMATGGTAPPGTSGFATRTSTAQGKIISGPTDGSGVPLLIIEASGKFRAVKFMQSGEDSVASVTGGASPVPYTVTFPVPFDVVPRVRANVKTTRPDLMSASAQSATTTTMTVYVWRSATGSVPFTWSADTAS